MGPDLETPFVDEEHAEQAAEAAAGLRLTFGDNVRITGLVHRLRRMVHGVVAETPAWRCCGLNHAFVSVH